MVGQDKTIGEKILKKLSTLAKVNIRQNCHKKRRTGGGGKTKGTTSRGVQGQTTKREATGIVTGGKYKTEGVE